MEAGRVDWIELAVIIVLGAAAWAAMAVTLTATVEGIAWGIEVAAERLTRWGESHG